MKLKVLTAKLHQSYFPGATGNLGDTLDTLDKHRGMELYLTENGLFGFYKTAYFVVPSANIVGVRLASDPFVEADKPKVASKAS